MVHVHKLDGALDDLRCTMTLRERWVHVIQSVLCSVPCMVPSMVPSTVPHKMHDERSALRDERLALHDGLTELTLHKMHEQHRVHGVRNRVK